MQLRRYLTRLHNIIDSRRELTIERLQIDEIVPGREGVIEGRLRFWDASLLEFVEVLVVRGVVLVKTDYAYHYQDQQNQLIFRYDNAPHHPQIATHPHHKPVVRQGGQSEQIEAAVSPHLNDVFHEIDQLLYPKNS